MAKTSYLARLPKSAQRRGSIAKGQIEIVTKKKPARKIDEENAAELKGSALGKGSKRIGILLEDKVHMVVRDPVVYPSGATGLIDPLPQVDQSASRAKRAAGTMSTESEPESERAAYVT